MNTRPLPFPYIPTYVSGELLLSWVMRIHSLNSISDSKETLAALFGSATGIPSADLPCRLQHFVTTTGTWGPFNTVASAAGKGSLFPYIARFLEPVRYRKVLTALANDQAGGLKVSVGLVANRFGASTLLKSCPVCDTQSLRDHGSYVLYRMHQLPGVELCPLHDTTLLRHGQQSLQSARQNLRLPLRSARRGHGMVSHNIEVPRPPLSPDPPSRNAIRFAHLSLEALESDASPVSRYLRVETYLARLEQLDFASRKKVDWPALTLAVLTEYDNFQGLEFRERLMSTSNHPLRWLKDLIERPERALHPICHLLLIGCLFKDLKAFIAATHAISPATKNSLSHQLPSKSTPQPGSAVPSSLLNDTSVSCRSLAELVGISVTTAATYRRSAGVPISERRKSLTEKVQQRGKELLCSGASIDVTCTSTGMSASSAYRLLRSLPGISLHRKRSQVEIVRSKRRADWLKIQRQYTQAGSSELRKRVPATFIWLYRHDKDWLSSNSPARRTRHPPRESLQAKWRRIDGELSTLICRQFRALKPLTIPGRVSTSMLLRWTGRPTTVRNNLFQLPLVVRALAACTESKEDYRRRKLAHAEKQLLSEGEDTPPDWRILRLAGIRT